MLKQNIAIRVIMYSYMPQIIFATVFALLSSSFFIPFVSSVHRVCLTILWLPMSISSFKTLFLKCEISLSLLALCQDKRNWDEAVHEVLLTPWNVARRINKENESTKGFLLISHVDWIEIASTHIISIVCTLFMFGWNSFVTAIVCIVF